jgi:hypothetical protein
MRNLDDVLLGGLLKGARQWGVAIRVELDRADMGALSTGLPRTDRVACLGSVIVVK